MRIGIQSAQLGPLADPAAVRSVAIAAEQLGYSSLWVVDRLPVAVAPRSDYGGIPGLAIPVEQRRALDPIAVMAAVAAVTTRLRVGSSVLVAPWYRPALLARSLTSLDVLSEGRLDVGLGVGWSEDERRAVGLPATEAGLGRRLDDLLDVLDAHWSADPIAYAVGEGAVEAAHGDLRPVQRPRPPVLLAAFSDPGLDRVARRADGWMPASLPLEALTPMWADVRDRAARHGRDPDALRLVVRANIALADRPLGADRPIYHGTIEQVVEDLEATRRVGAHEAVLAIGGPVGVDEVLDACARIAEEVAPDVVDRLPAGPM